MKNLKIIRRANGLTQKKLADTLGVSVSTIKAWESGRRKIKKQTFLLIQKLYLVDVAYD